MLLEEVNTSNKIALPIGLAPAGKSYGMLDGYAEL